MLNCPRTLHASRPDTHRTFRSHAGPQQQERRFPRSLTGPAQVDLISAVVHTKTRVGGATIVRTLLASSEQTSLTLSLPSVSTCEHHFRDSCICEPRQHTPSFNPSPPDHPKRTQAWASSTRGTAVAVSWPLSGETDMDSGAPRQRRHLCDHDRADREYSDMGSDHRTIDAPPRLVT